MIRRTVGALALRMAALGVPVMRCTLVQARGEAHSACMPKCAAEATCASAVMSGRHLAHRLDGSVKRAPDASHGVLRQRV